MKFWKHLKTITYHKWLVMKGCFRIGLYRQGLLHDMSKYSPAEFLVGCKYFQGNMSPNNVERLDKGYSSAWLHHKGRNKHHMEYWIDYGLPPEKGMVGMRMPERYVAEMFVDRVAASKVYKKEAYTQDMPLAYYENVKDTHVMHPETTALLEKMLHMLAEKGEDATYRYIREEVLHK